MAGSPLIPLLTKSLATAAYPLLAARAIFNEAWRKSLPERRGFGAWESLATTTARRIWFHGASVGEINGMKSVFSEAREVYPDCEFVITTTSVTGRESARENSYADYACLIPLDYPAAVSRVLERVRPSLVVITETELWPNLYQALIERGIPVVLVNARISNYSFPNYQRFKYFLKPLLTGLKTILAQTKTDRERLVALGAPAERVFVSGSTKYDIAVEAVGDEERAERAASFGLSAEKPIIVAGSVRPEEDEIVIDAFRAAKQSLPGIQLIIAPRHPERFDAVAQLLEKRSVGFNRRSAGDATQRQDVLLLDTLGELMNAYVVASVSFVGATLVDIGGHNPLEPAAYRSPVLAGPYSSNVKDAVYELKRAGALFEVRNQHELTERFRELCSNEEKRVRAGNAAHAVWEQNLGATKAVIEAMTAALAPQDILSSATKQQRVIGS